MQTAQQTRLLVAIVSCLALGTTTQAQIVPGTGQKLAQVGDDFEDEKWAWVGHLPKSSSEQDEQMRLPGGVSTNGRWAESGLRGAPDHVVRVETPEGGIEGSKGSLKLQTLYSGVPRNWSGRPMQDDFLANVSSRVGGNLHVSQSPSVVVRVYVPPFEHFEKRTGNSFGFRLGNRSSERTPRKKKGEDPSSYWPGMFIHFNSTADRRTKEDNAVLVIRCDERGRDFTGPKVEPGWWTLGMSCTSDGAIHYYAHAGVENLTAKDRIASKYPYGFHCQQFATFFFDLVNTDDGKTWSTPWVIDDPSVYVVRGR